MSNIVQNLMSTIDEVKDKISDDEYLRLCNYANSINKYIVSESTVKIAQDLCPVCTRRGDICECDPSLLFERLLDLPAHVEDLNRVIARLNIERLYTGFM